MLDSKWPAIPRRDGRVAEGARLESVYTARYPGFESLSLRHKVIQDLPVMSNSFNLSFAKSNKPLLNRDLAELSTIAKAAGCFPLPST